MKWIFLAVEVLGLGFLCWMVSAAWIDGGARVGLFFALIVFLLAVAVLLAFCEMVKTDRFLRRMKKGKI